MSQSKKQIFDLIVIGAGFAGLSAAYHFTVKGKQKVLILEKGDGKDNASFASTAEMNHDPDIDWQKVIKKFGVEQASLIWKLNEQEIKRLSLFAHSPNITHFETKRASAFLCGHTKKDLKDIRKKFELYKKIGAPVELFTSVSDTFFKHALCIKNDGKTNNQAILAGLKKVIHKQGGKVLYRTEVVSVTKKDKNLYEINTSSKVYYSKKILIATGDQGIVGLDVLPIRKIKTFVTRYALNKKETQQIKENVFWDTAHPFHYIRAFGDRELWVGGEDVILKSGISFDESKKVAVLRDYVENKIQIAKGEQYLGHWSGTFFESERSVPYIYQDQNTGIMYSVGFGGSGLLISLASGYLQYMWQKGKMKEYKKIFDKDWR